jgi:glutamyl endopeptidase
MPNPLPATGLHTPITNIIPSESNVADPLFSEGSMGQGEVIELEEGATFETANLPEIAFENAYEVKAPDTTDLLDVGVASFGEPPRFESVIGTDQRRLITETKKYPWRAIASLLITAADNSQWVGTAWFISPRTLITAGHCVYIKGSDVPARNGWVKKIQVMPGRNGSSVPFGGIYATEFWTVQGWGDQGVENFDYGAIIIPAAFTEDLGYFGFGAFDDAKLLASTVNVAGYPGDKDSGTLWYDNRHVGSVKPSKVYYAADTAGGQSGAGVYIIEGGKRVCVAIHAYGGNTANSGTRISSEVFANLEAWKRS